MPCLLQSHGTQGANDPSWVGSCLRPSIHDSQNCPTYPSGQVHISTQLAGLPKVPRRAVSKTTSSNDPKPNGINTLFFYGSPNYITIYIFFTNNPVTEVIQKKKTKLNYYDIRKSIRNHGFKIGKAIVFQ